MIEMGEDHTRGRKGEVMLAYGLNKNLKGLSKRPKSAKPKKQKRQKRGAFDEFD